MKIKNYDKKKILDDHMRALELMHRLILQKNRLERHIRELMRAMTHARNAAERGMMDTVTMENNIHITKQLIKDSESQLQDAMEMMRATSTMMHPFDKQWLPLCVCEN